MRKVAGKKEAGQNFVKGLLHWHETQNNRKMPWKGETDPYRIWLSEIILQQTRVEQGLKYYERFILEFPTVELLAGAAEEKVFKAWEGLGYYSRCRNLIHTARYIAQDLNGIFPSVYEDILALKGVGPYTAAAIGSFAFNLPRAVLDGNVFRVLARMMNADQPIDTTEGKQWFSALAQSLLPPSSAAVYNQAIMDFGATVCKPLPLCAECFFQSDCGAFRHHRQNILPVKSRKKTRKQRWFHYILLQCGDKVAIRIRQDMDIWRGLHEFLLIEENHQAPEEEILKQLDMNYGINASEYEVVSSLSGIKQQLTHQSIHFSMQHLALKMEKKVPHMLWIPLNELKHFAFPITLQSFLSNNPHLSGWQTI